VGYEKSITTEVGEEIKLDEEGLNDLFEKHRAKLRKTAQLILGDRLSTRCDGSDAVQMALQRAFLSIHSFHGATEKELLGWLHAILKNAVLKLVRTHIEAAKRSILSEEATQSKERSFLWHETARAAGNPSANILEGETAEKFALALEHLSDSHFEVVQLRFFEGLKIEEISRVLDISVEAVAGRLKRAIQALRHLLSSESYS